MRLWPRRHGTSLDLLVVGLGNPGREHARNRHNVGWLVVDELARRHGGSWRGKFDGQLAEIRIDGHKVALLKPETYMNESGKSVRAAAAFFKTDPTPCSSCTTRATSTQAACRLGSAVGSRVTTACARSRSTSVRPTSCGCASASAAPAAATSGGSRTTCSQTSSHTTTPERLVASAADAVETLDAEGLEAAQRAVNGKRS